ncbi:hypothetical protein OG194_18805 [Streptomyces sp. NBC_01288]|uniref:hypothetical protein n=1 Tax=Streptomyces sp. NBC_01288 TaxID=2903814 RepID=UPI002E123A14|nr:hypothetical protein OG194_18805 [Streptomyces sp. NBC_01288]
MRNPSNPPVSASAVMHAERIRAREQSRSTDQGAAPAAQSTAERYAARILPGYRADAELREQARMRELVARGVITPESDVEEDDEAYEEYEEEEVDEDVEEEAEPKTTAELYAAREQARQRAEHKATVAAHRGSTWLITERATRPIF